MDGKTYEALIGERVEELQQFYDQLEQTAEQEKMVHRARYFFEKMAEKGHGQEKFALYLPNPMLR